MREYSWERATITPDEIIDGLVKQYGPEQPISVEMDNRKAQIPYKNSMATCECHRCGSIFSMTPASILNAYYNTGYVCLKCGPLSDDQLRAKQKDRMNERAIEELQKHGVDIFAENEEEKKAKEEAAEDNRVALSTEDYQDAFDEIDEETSNDEDISKYMATDDDDKVSISESASVDVEEETVEDDSAEVDDSTEAEDAEKSVVDFETEKQKAVEEAKQEAMREAQKKSDEEKAAYENKLRAEMEARMKAELEAEKAKAAAEIEAAKKAQEQAEKFAAEANLRAQEAEQALEAIGDDSESEVTEEPDDYDDDQTEEYTDESEESDVKEDEDDGVEEGFSLEESDESEIEEEYFDHVVGNEGYSQDEFDSIVEEHLENLKKKTGIQSWSRASFDTDDSGHIIASCRLCGQTTKLDSFDDIDKVIVVDDNFCKLNNIKLGKINNKDGKSPLMSTCSCCKESLINNGFNEYHRNTIEGLARESHFKIINADNHLFVPSLNEIFTVECNGIQKDLTFAELCLFNGKDAREDPMFNNEKEKSDEKPLTEHKVIRPVSNNTETKDASIESHKPIVLKAEAPIKEEVKEENNKSSEGSSIFKKSEPKTMYDKYNGGPKIENIKDSNAYLDEEKSVEQEEIAKNTIFKPGQKLVLSKKNVAKLNNKQNPFEREQALEEQFRETKMAKFISDLSTESEIKCNLIINNKTYELPVIDFESGLRVICADLEERSMPNVPFNLLGDPKVLPFTFYENTATDDGTGVYKKRPKKFNWLVLFSDAIEERHDATFMALMKYVNPKKLAYDGQRIQLEGNLNIEYTTYDQFLRDFDVRYSPFPGGKPKTGQLGILATWDSSKAVTTKDVLKFQLQASGMDNVANLNSLEDESSQYMVASIRYIERFNNETNRVIYTITEYVEIGSCFIADGLAQCVRALLKEYMLKYPQMRSVEPYIIIECDPNSLTSPSVKNYLKRGSIVPMNDTMRMLIYGSQFRPGRGVDQYLRYSYVRRPEYRSKDSDYLRHDMRMFSVGTLVRTMQDEIKQAGIQNTIRDPDVKNRFIANMGYVKARQAEIKEMFMDQSTVTSLLYDSKTTLMRKHIEADGNMFQNTAMVTDSTTGIGMNNIFTNPNLINRYQRIMERGTPEAKQHMLNLMYQSNPMMAAQIQMMGGFGMQQPGSNMQQNNFGMPQMNYWFK